MSKDMCLLDKMDCKYVPAIYSGNIENDNRANTDLYLRLLEEGDEKGFCPVLIDRSINHYVNPSRYGYTDSKEDYPKIVNRLIHLVESNCFSVWLGRLIYNYYLDGEDLEDEIKNDLARLETPADKEYLKHFESEVVIKEFCFGYGDQYKPYDFSYENHVFVLVPTEKPWQVLAWIPMGGFNWCPDELHQIALAKGLYELFGARITYISFTALEYYVPSPIVDKETFEKAAKILIAADNDVYEDYEVSATNILGNHNWYMWWD